MYAFDMSCIRKQAMLEPLVDTVDANQIVTHSQLLKVCDDVSTHAPFPVSFTYYFLSPV